MVDDLTPERLAGLGREWEDLEAAPLSSSGSWAERHVPALLSMAARVPELEKKAVLWDYYQDLVKLHGFESITDTLCAAKPDGWLYFNPDTGTEWSENHPVESGEVPDAKKIRAGTAVALQGELIPAWERLADAEAQRDAAQADAKAMREALEPFAKAAAEISSEDEDDEQLFDHPAALDLTIGDLKRAATALAAHRAQQEKGA